MSDRSVAEILGWTEHTTDSALVHLYRPPDGCWRPEPTVDDMLAFLDDPRGERHNWQVVSISPLLIGGWKVGICRSMDYVQREAPTLHAALEAAVRAVAERGEP